MPRLDKNTNAGGNYYGNSLQVVAPGTDQVAGTLDVGIVNQGYSTLRLSLVVTAVGGTGPTLDVTIQHSPDNSTWATLGSPFTQKTGAGTQRQIFTGVDRFVRAHCVVGGTGGAHVTYGLTGDAI